MAASSFTYRQKRRQPLASVASVFSAMRISLPARLRWRWSGTRQRLLGRHRPATCRAIRLLPLPVRHHRTRTRTDKSRHRGRKQCTCLCQREPSLIVPPLTLFPELFKMRPGIVVRDNLRCCRSSQGPVVGAPLRHAHAMAPAPAGHGDAAVADRRDTGNQR